MNDYREDADVRINDIESRGIIFKGDSVLLMFRRKDGEEYYTFPGGHMRKGESPEQTALREVEEETTIIAKDLVKVIEHIETVKREKRQYYFLGKWESGTPILSGEESRRATKDNFYEPMWVHYSKINTLLLYPEMAKDWFVNYVKKVIEINK